MYSKARKFGGELKQIGSLLSIKICQTLVLTVFPYILSSKEAKNPAL